MKSNLEKNEPKDPQEKIIYLRGMRDMCNDMADALGIFGKYNHSDMRAFAGEVGKLIDETDKEIEESS